MRRRDHDEIVSQQRERIRFLERQNEELLNRLMYATDRTWTPPPPSLDANVSDLPEPYSATPEQYLDELADIG